MPSAEGIRLSKSIRRKAEEMNELCKGLDEGAASRAPAGRWSPRQILSHLCGPEGVGFVPAIRAILEQNTPRLDIEAENPFYTERRSGMTFSELLTEFRKEYAQLAETAAGLSDEQLARKAHIPLFKESPVGEYPTLAVFVSALGEEHMEFHINHMREILQALGVAYPE